MRMQTRAGEGQMTGIEWQAGRAPGIGLRLTESDGIRQRTLHLQRERKPLCELGRKSPGVRRCLSHLCGPCREALMLPTLPAH